MSPKEQISLRKALTVDGRCIIKQIQNIVTRTKLYIRANHIELKHKTGNDHWERLAKEVDATETSPKSPLPAGTPKSWLL